MKDGKVRQEEGAVGEIEARRGRVGGEKLLATQFQTNVSSISFLIQEFEVDNLLSQINSTFRSKLFCCLKLPLLVVRLGFELLNCEAELGKDCVKVEVDDGVV